MALLAPIRTFLRDAQRRSGSIIGNCDRRKVDDAEIALGLERQSARSCNINAPTAGWRIRYR